MKIIDCQKISNEFCEIVKERIQAVSKVGDLPCINFIRVENCDCDDNRYIYDKDAFAKQMGIKSFVHVLDCNVTTKDIADLIDKLNRDNSVHAISLQAHLPKRLSFRSLVNLINVNKDVEGLTTLNQGCLFSGEPGIIPCTPLGIMHLLRSVYDNLEGLHAVIVGRSSMVGRPLAQLLLNANCTVTSLHSYSRDLPEVCRNADILVSAVGKAHLISAECVKPGATVIDVGLSKVITDDGTEKFVGDVDFKAIKDRVGAITSAEGVEPMTLAYLVHNTLKLACCY